VRRGYSPTGGAERFLARFAEAARSAGRDVRLVNDRPWPEAVIPGIPQTTLPARGPRAFAVAVERWRASHPGVLFSLERLLAADCYRAGDGVHAAWLRRRAVYDPVWEVWMRRVLPKQRQMLRLEARCFSPLHTGAVIVNSAMVGREIGEMFAYPTDRIHLVRNGVPADFASRLPGRDEARRQLGLGDRAFVAAFAGTGWKRKGLRFAVAALEAAGMPGAVLAVAGRGPESRHGAPGVLFLGPQADVRPLLAAADVFILPTVYDPFSNACLEALAAGLPVITTRANGCAEVLDEGVTGSVVPEPHDVAALAAALRYWAQDGRAAGAAPGCRSAAASCSLTDNVRRTLEVLDGLASR
jgi:UDP-glucose:(heptosyl)LPS alpha-1,3-glucosyltransferase